MKIYFKKIVLLLGVVSTFVARSQEDESNLLAKGGAKGNGATVVLTFVDSEEGRRARVEVEKIILENKEVERVTIPLQETCFKQLRK